MQGIINNHEYIKHEKEKSKLRMGGGSWTINLDWLADQTADINRIVYITEKAIYEISVEKAIAHGFERILGGERKLIVPLTHWTITNN